MKREKRLEKGIESLETQIEVHEKKLEEAAEIGDEDLMRYYVGEIRRLKNRKDNREEKLDRK